MRFKVPQDVQRDDTILGPITLKQLGILGIGFMVDYAIYISLAKQYFIEVWILPIAIVTAFTIAFAFVKVHEMTFFRYLLSLIEYMTLDRKRSWKQGTGEIFESVLTVKQKSKEELKAEEKRDKDKEKDLKQLSALLDKHAL